MSDQNDKNQNAKSKIEQIREELEKKLAAIEKTKTDSQSESENIDNNIVKEEINLVKDNSSIVEEKIEKVEEKNDLIFEISDEIEDVDEDSSATIENVNEDSNAPIENIKKELSNKAAKITESSTAKKIVEEPVKVEKKIAKIESLKEIVKSDTSLSVNKKVEDKQKTIIPPPKTVATAVHVNQSKPTISSNKEVKEKAEEFVAYVEEKPKKKSNYLLYALLLLLFGAIAYLLVNYLNQNKEQQKIIMDQKLSEFKNKRYLDSIELADLNGQLLDLQSIKMIDSLDQIHEQELIDSSKFKNKKEIKRNFNVDGKEIVNNSKKANKTNKSKITDDAITKANNSVAANINETNTGIVQNLDKTNLGVDDVNNNTSDSNDNSVAKSESIDSKEAVAKQPKVVKVPIYPGCEKKKTEIDKKKCLTSKMYRSISRHFNADLAQNIGLKEGKHVVRVNFIIDKSGYATVLNVRAENKILEQEAIRVVQALPKMKPGTVNGKRSKTPYNIPISYIVEN